MCDWKLYDWKLYDLYINKVDEVLRETKIRHVRQPSKWPGNPPVGTPLPLPKVPSVPSLPDTPSKHGSYRDIPFNATNDSETDYHMRQGTPPKKLYHVAPRKLRKQILADGLEGTDTWNTGAGMGDEWKDEMLWTQGEDGNLFPFEYRPVGVYMFPSLEAAQGYYNDDEHDIYEIDTDVSGGEVIRDPSQAVNWDYAEDSDKTYVTRYVPPSALKLVNSPKDKPVKPTRTTSAQLHDEIAGRKQPPKMGTTPIPKGHIRLYHQTRTIEDADNIATNGIRINADNPDVGGSIWASAGKPWGEPDDRLTVEFHVPIEDLTDFGQDTRDIRDGTVAPEDAEKHTIILTKPIPVSDIIAMHAPWSFKAQYIEDNPDVLKDTLAGVNDFLLDDEDYGPAIRLIKDKYGTSPE